MSEKLIFTGFKKIRLVFNFSLHGKIGSRIFSATVSGQKCGIIEWDMPVNIALERKTE